MPLASVRTAAAVGVLLGSAQEPDVGGEAAVYREVVHRLIAQMAFPDEVARVWGGVRVEG